MSDFDQIIVGEEWENTDLSLLETLDHVLNRGLVQADIGHSGNANPRPSAIAIT